MVKKGVKFKNSNEFSKNPIEQKIKINPHKFNLVLRFLFLFIILFVICLLFYSITSAPLLNNTFFLLMIIFGFTSLAFLIVFLIFTFYKLLKK
jgi:hypothetical protein